MIATQITYKELLCCSNAINADLVFVFSKRDKLYDYQVMQRITTFFDKASVVLCSGSGEIKDTEVVDDDLVISALKFSQNCFNTRVYNIGNYSNSYEVGQIIGLDNAGANAKHLLIFADGSLVNGSELVRGINDTAPKSLGVSGGLAGDGTNFEKTLVGLNEDVREGNIVAVEFYGEKINISTACNGGWKPFGPFRKITKAMDNVLYEIDGLPALELYKEYLGERASELPGSALLFPLSICYSGNDSEIVRTILAINEENSSMTFAGNMPVGSTIRLMMANKDDLIEAAGKTATASILQPPNETSMFALLVSCVGRRLALGNRTEEELEAVKEKLGEAAVMGGFYSYGEISADFQGKECHLHNQTMAITVITEDEP